MGLTKGTMSTKDCKCSICGKELFNVNNNTKYCGVCRIKQNNLRHKRWRDAHPDKVREYIRKHQQTEEGRVLNRIACKKWREHNPNYSNEYYLSHKDEYRDEYRDKQLEANRKYMKTPAGRLANSKRQQRHIGKGFVLMMNNPFPEEIPIDYHHIYQDLPFVIPLPRITHRYVMGSNHFLHNLNWIKLLYGL